ncbi:MAG: hypothetical protein ACLGI3_21160 [Actinomycetes bacterium]
MTTASTFSESTTTTAATIGTMTQVSTGARPPRPRAVRVFVPARGRKPLSALRVAAAYFRALPACHWFQGMAQS